MKLRGLWAVGLALAWLPAQAALFEDEEAREAINALRAKVTQLEEAQKQAATSKELQEQLAQLRRSLGELLNRNEALRQELARLQGANEQMARDLADTQRRLADQLQGFDARLKPLEPQKVSLDGKDFKVEPEEQRQYEAAMGLLRRGEFGPAATAFEGFLKRFTASGYAETVRFWLGNAQYGERDYKGAIATFRDFMRQAPQHPRVAEAMLALANCQIEMKDLKAARKTLDDLIKAHPASEAAQAAKERRAGLK